MRISMRRFFDLLRPTGRVSAYPFADNVRSSSAGDAVCAIE
jgi:hypothetical protein